MKKVLTVAIVLVLCLMIAVPVAAANGTAVNSPETFEIFFTGTSMESSNLVEFGLTEEMVENLDSCIVITTIEQAEKKTTDITQEERDLLLETYAGLEDGSVKLPVEGCTVRELVDISFKHNACRAVEAHGHKDEALKQEDATLTMRVNIGVGADEKVCVMTFVDGQWAEIEEAVNNGDGTVTCVFEDLCPVAFAVKE